MKFEEYLPQADLELTPDKISDLETLYAYENFEQFNRLLLCKSLGGLVPHMSYDTITDLVKNELSLLNNRAGFLAEVPRFIKDVEGCHHAMAQHGSLAYTGEYLSNPDNSPEALAHVLGNLGNSVTDTAQLIARYQRGDRISVSTYTKSGDTSSVTFKSHEDVTKKIIKVLGKELTGKLKLREPAAREN